MFAVSDRSCPKEHFPLVFSVIVDPIPVIFFGNFRHSSVFLVILDFIPVVLSVMTHFVVATGRPPVGKVFFHQWSTPGHYKMRHGHCGGAAMGSAVATGELSVRVANNGVTMVHM